MDNYEVLNQIGKGNFGSISKILRKSDKQLLVWKELDYGQMSEKEKQQIVSEVNILRELKHQNIVRYYDRILDKKHARIYIIMEYCEGGDLGQLIKRCKKNKEYIAEDVIWKIFTQIVLALHVCHSRKEGKVLHRDIKPSNVFLDKDNNVKLGDFGLSRVLSNESNFAYSHVGTPYYMSPEQIDEMRYNDKSDIWSLGCFLYEITTFNPPFEAKNHVMLAMRIKSGKVEKIHSRYSEELWRVITWMLNVNQHHRPSIEELLNVPQVSIRLREKRIKENLNKIKVYEETLKLKEEELKHKESMLECKEKELKEKEERLNEKEKTLNELNKRVSSISTNNMPMFSYNSYKTNNSNNVNQYRIMKQINNANSDLGNLISYGNNNKTNHNNIAMTNTNLNTTIGDDFGFLTNNNISTKISTSNYMYDDNNGIINSASKNKGMSYYNTNSNSNINTSQNIPYYSSKLLFQTNNNNNNQHSNRIINTSYSNNQNNSHLSHGNAHNNSLHQQSYEVTPFEHTSTLISTNISTSIAQTKRNSLNNPNNNSTNITKTHSNFTFDPSIYSDNNINTTIEDTNPSNKNSNHNTIYCSSTSKSPKKNIITKRAHTPKTTTSTNRNYPYYTTNVVTTRNNNMHNTPTKTNYYYNKYINNTQDKNNNKTINGNNGIVEYSNRNGSKGKKTKTQNHQVNNSHISGSRINLQQYNIYN